MSNSLDYFENWVESDEFMRSPRYDQYCEDANRTAKRKLKMFNDSHFINDRKFNKQLKTIHNAIVSLELMQYEYKEKNAYFDAKWDEELGTDHQLPDIYYLERNIDEEINDLCYWGESHAY